MPLESLRELVGADPAATHIVTEAADGFTISIPMAKLESAGLRAYVVVGMNGRRLTVAHGAPARVLVPGLYGQFAGVKWLTGIRFVDHHVPGDWERRGWPPRPVMVLPHARIDQAREIGRGRRSHPV